MLKFIISGINGMVLGIILGFGAASLSNMLNPPVYGMRYAPIDGYWPGLLAMLLMSTFMIIAQAHAHAAKRFEDRKTPFKHGWRTLVRILVAFAMASVINAFNYNLLKVIDLTLFGLCWFGIAFNYTLNRKRGLAWDYLSRGTRASLPDKLFSRIKNGGIVLYILQLIGMILTSYLYCLQ